MKTTLRLKDDIHELMINSYCIPEDVSMNKMINILLAEALNAREIKKEEKHEDTAILINEKTGKYIWR